MIKGFMTSMITFWTGCLTTLVLLEILSESDIQTGHSDWPSRVIKWLCNPVYAGKFEARTFLKIYLFVCLLDTLENTIFRIQKERFFIHFVLNFVGNNLISQMFGLDFGFSIFCISLLRIGWQESPYAKIKFFFFAIPIQFVSLLYIFVTLTSDPLKNINPFCLSIMIANFFFFIDNNRRLLGFSYVYLVPEAKILREKSDAKLAEIYYESLVAPYREAIEGRKEGVVGEEIGKEAKLTVGLEQITSDEEWRRVFGAWKTFNEEIGLESGVEWKAVEPVDKIERYGFRSRRIRNWMTWNFN